MKNKVRKLELKKIIQEYNFLLTDEKYKQEVISENKSDFLKEIHERKIELGLIDDQPFKEESEDSDKKESKTDVNTEELNDSSEEESGGDPQSESAEKDKLEDSKRERSKKSKTIYREIVKHTHPDKVGSDEKISLYNKATDAYNKNQIIELYFIAIELNLDVELSEEDFDNINKTINQKRKELHNLEMSFLWLWYNAKNKEQKQKVVALFINKTHKQ